MVDCDDDDGTSTLCLTFFLSPFKNGLKRLNNPFKVPIGTQRFPLLKTWRMKKTLKEGQIPPLAWMVLVITGILCLYYYRGMGSRFNGQGQERNEKKESAYTTLGRDLGASGISITGKPDSRIIDRHKAGETNHLGNISILLKAYYSWPSLVSCSVSM
jgi:hypothetical protein